MGIGSVSTYVAKQSFATVQMQADGNVAYISKDLSHSNIKTTQTYLGSFTSVAIKRQVEKLTKYKKK